MCIRSNVHTFLWTLPKIYILVFFFLKRLSQTEYTSGPTKSGYAFMFNKRRKGRREKEPAEQMQQGRKGRCPWEEGSVGPAGQGQLEARLDRMGEDKRENEREDERTTSPAPVQSAWASSRPPLGNRATLPTQTPNGGPSMDPSLYLLDMHLFLPRWPFPTSRIHDSPTGGRRRKLGGAGGGRGRGERGKEEEERKERRPLLEISPLHNTRPCLRLPVLGGKLLTDRLHLLFPLSHLE